MARELSVATQDRLERELAAILGLDVGAPPPPGTRGMGGHRAKAAALIACVAALVVALSGVVILVPTQLRPGAKPAPHADSPIADAPLAVGDGEERQRTGDTAASSGEANGGAHTDGARGEDAGDGSGREVGGAARRTRHGAPRGRRALASSSGSGAATTPRPVPSGMGQMPLTGTALERSPSMPSTRPGATQIVIAAGAPAPSLDAPPAAQAAGTAPAAPDSKAAADRTLNAIDAIRSLRRQ